MIDLNRVYHERLRQSDLEELTNRLRVERLIQAQSSVWAKSVPRARERESTRYDPVVKTPQWAVGIDWQHDDIPLHELLRRLEREGERLRAPGNRLEFLSHFFYTHRGRHRTRARRSGERYVGRFVAGQLWIVALVDRA